MTGLKACYTLSHVKITRTLYKEYIYTGHVTLYAEVSAGRHRRTLSIVNTSEAMHELAMLHSINMLFCRIMCLTFLGQSLMIVRRKNS